MFFDSKEYIGLTVNKGEIKLIEKPPESFITTYAPKNKTRVLHGRDCDCEDCLETLITELKFKFDTENDE
jgi:hypothetical protein